MVEEGLKKPIAPNLWKTWTPQNLSSRDPLPIWKFASRTPSKLGPPKGLEDKFLVHLVLSSGTWANPRRQIECLVFPQNPRRQIFLQKEGLEDKNFVCRQFFCILELLGDCGAWCLAFCNFALHPWMQRHNDSIST